MLPEIPVVVRVVGVVASFNPLCKQPQLASVQLKVLNNATSGVEMDGQQGQEVAWGSLSVCKDVKLPVVLSILQYQQYVLCLAATCLQQRQLQHMQRRHTASCSQHPAVSAICLAASCLYQHAVQAAADMTCHLLAVLSSFS